MVFPYGWLEKKNLSKAGPYIDEVRNLIEAKI